MMLQEVGSGRRRKRRLQRGGDRMVREKVKGNCSRGKVIPGNLFSYVEYSVCGVVCGMWYVMYGVVRCMGTFMYTDVAHSDFYTI